MFARGEPFEITLATVKPLASRVWRQLHERLKLAELSFCWFFDSVLYKSEKHNLLCLELRNIQRLHLWAIKNVIVMS